MSNKPTTASPPAQTVVTTVVAAAVVSTVIHYTDNYVNFDRYPQPDSIQRGLVFPVLLLATAVAVAGYAAYRRGDWRRASLCFAVYSITGISSLGHYLYGSMSDFSAKMHVFILADGLTGLAILGLALWMLRPPARRVAP